MNALFDFIPNYCPNCGCQLVGKQKATKDWTPTEDYNRFASHVCLACDLKYQRADTEHILDAADRSDGDMKRYAEREATA